MVHNEMMLADAEQIVELNKEELETNEMYLNQQLKLLLLKQQSGRE